MEALFVKAYVMGDHFAVGLYLGGLFGVYPKSLYKMYFKHFEEIFLIRNKLRPSSSSVQFKLESDLVCLRFVKFNLDSQIISFSFQNQASNNWLH